MVRPQGAFMSTVSDRIHSIVTAFTAEVTAVIREDITAAIGGALSAPRPLPSPATVPRAPKTKTWRKRSPQQIAKVQADVLDFITKNPGCSVEDVKKALKLDITEVTLPVTKLLAAKQ